MAAPFLIPPASGVTLGESLQRRGVSRRALKYASYLGALMALPASATQAGVSFPIQSGHAASAAPSQIS